VIRPLALFLAPAFGILGLGLGLGMGAAQSTASSEEWRSMTDLPYVDMSGLSAKQKKAVLDVLRVEGCTCGCSMKLAECRVKDPRCSTSRPLAARVVTDIRAGKSVDEIRKALQARASEPAAVLDPPVNIPIAGAPFKGPLEARLTLVEFSDYQ
jgi:hypothetical protein